MDCLKPYSMDYLDLKEEFLLFKLRGTEKLKLFKKNSFFCQFYIRTSNFFIIINHLIKIWNFQFKTDNSKRRTERITEVQRIQVHVIIKFDVVLNLKKVSFIIRQSNLSMERLPGTGRILVQKVWFLKITTQRFEPALGVTFNVVELRYLKVQGIGIKVRDIEDFELSRCLLRRSKLISLNTFCRYTFCHRTQIFKHIQANIYLVVR